MKCLTNNLEVNYPCSAACPLYGDCVTAFRKEQEQRVRTNADRIRCMSDEELAEFLDRWEMGDIDYSKTFCDLCEGQYDCHDDCWLDWLKQEVKE